MASITVTRAELTALAEILEAAECEDEVTTDDIAEVERLISRARLALEQVEACR